MSSSSSALEQFFRNCEVFPTSNDNATSHPLTTVIIEMDGAKSHETKQVTKRLSQEERHCMQKSKCLQEDAPPRLPQRGNRDAAPSTKTSSKDDSENKNQEGAQERLRPRGSPHSFNKPPIAIVLQDEKKACDKCARPLNLARTGSYQQDAMAIEKENSTIRSSLTSSSSKKSFCCFHETNQGQNLNIFLSPTRRRKPTDKRRITTI